MTPAVLGAQRFVLTQPPRHPLAAPRAQAAQRAAAAQGRNLYRHPRTAPVPVAVAPHLVRTGE